MSKKNIIPVIDLFAGPGGLGEGFSALTDKKGSRVFRISLSIENEKYAHQTLELRSFYRQFDKDSIPIEYYQHIRGELSREELFKKYPNETQKAKSEALKIKLGDIKFEKEIDDRIADSLNNKKIWVLIGGPPCQAYSLVGRSRKQQKEGIDEGDEKVYLYKAYYRILAVHNPPIFIMENVKGLLSSKVKGKGELLFKKILNDLINPAEAYNKLDNNGNKKLSCPGYKIYSLVKGKKAIELSSIKDFDVNDLIIKSEDYGIPQTRHRVILLGIRNDINAAPKKLKKCNQVNLNMVLQDLPRLRSGLSKDGDDGNKWKEKIENLVSNGLLKVNRKLKREIKQTISEITIPLNNRGGEYVKGKSRIKHIRNWYVDNRIKGFLNHSTRAHLTEDLYRYLFAACYAKLYKRSPKISDFPNTLLPNHNNVDDAIENNKFADRFRVQLKNKPSKTITSHISKDGHYYIHYDPTQCRSLTVREAARIQTFPDNYFFCGPRTSQYIQVGNAVPPLLANKIAKIVFHILK